MGIELRHRCRNPHCRMNLPQPTDNPHKAFCTEQDAARVQRDLDRAKELSFEQVAQQWLDKKDAEWTGQTATNIRRQLEMHMYPRLGLLPIQMLDTSSPGNSAVMLLVRAFKPIWQVKVATAQNLAWVLNDILSFAKADNLIGRDDAMEIVEKHKLPKIEKFYVPKHHAHMPWQDMPEFMAGIRAYTSPKLIAPLSEQFKCAICERPDIAEINKARSLGASAADLARKFNANLPGMERHLAHTDKPDKRPISSWCLESMILTAVRREMATSAKWCEIDVDKRIWFCSEHKTARKTKGVYPVALSSAVMNVLDAMRKRQELRGYKSEYVFVQDGLDTRPLHPATINQYMTKALKRTDCTPHGFRTTFKSWSIEHGYDERDSEMILGHAIGTVTRNSYSGDAKRFEPLRLILEAWANYCGQTKLPAGVVNFRKRKAS